VAERFKICGLGAIRMGAPVLLEPAIGPAERRLSLLVPPAEPKVCMTGLGFILVEASDVPDIGVAETPYEPQKGGGP